MSLSEASLRSLDEMTPMPGDCHGLTDEAERLAASLEAAVSAGHAGAVPDDAMRVLMAALIKVYAAKFDEGQRPALLPEGCGVSATAVLVATSALMRASNLEIFELGMWQSWSGTR